MFLETLNIGSQHLFTILLKEIPLFDLMAGIGTLPILLCYVSTHYKHNNKHK